MIRSYDNRNRYCVVCEKHVYSVKAIKGDGYMLTDVLKQRLINNPLVDIEVYKAIHKGNCYNQLYVRKHRQ